MLNAEEGGFSLPKMYGLKRKICQKAGDIPAVMKDQQGNIVSNKQSLLNLYKSVYMDRLAYKDILPEWKEIKNLQNNLFEARNETAKSIKTEDWTEEKIKTVCKKLKNDKARDVNGMIYELFKEPVAGPDIFQSLTKLFNGMKEEMFVPQFMESMGITSLYKNKGERSDFKNQRGIFNLSKVRGILDKALYEEVYDIIDDNLSDSNVGGRKGRNVRDHLFLIYAIINEVKNGNAKPICIQTFDIYKCFDEMDYEETHNDLYDAGVKNDLFSMIAKLDEKCSVKVKTPCGQTDNFKLERLVLQGSVFGPIKCSIQIDTLGRDSMIQNSCLYLYKGLINVTALAMVDDVLTVNECHTDSVEANAIINAKMELKKLRLSKDKCYQIHIGKNKDGKSCGTNLKVHNDVMKKESSGPYLGDIISSDGSIDLTIENRRQRGVGIISQITGIINNVSLGVHYFSIALALRECMFVNGLLFNSEVWYSVKAKHLETLENIDQILLRKMFKAHSKTALEALFLEAGIIPLRFIIAKRRLMYLWTILQRPEEEMLKKVYKTQKVVRTSGDWANIIEEELKTYNINLTDEEIEATSKYTLKNLVKRNVDSEALKYLNEKAAKHSKSGDLIKSEISEERYLTDKRFSLSEVQLLFKLRTRMLDVKKNSPSLWNNVLTCRICKDEIEIESQEHLLRCKEIQKHV